jgi:hypothetical protein
MIPAGWSNRWKCGGHHEDWRPVSQTCLDHGLQLNTLKRFHPLRYISHVAMAVRRLATTLQLLKARQSGTISARGAYLSDLRGGSDVGTLISFNCIN